MMLLQLFCLLGLVATVSSSHPSDALRKLPARFAKHLDSSTVSTLRDQYFVSTKKASGSKTKESWWPLWQSSTNSSSNSTAVDKEEEKPEQTPKKKSKAKRRWGPKKEEDETEKEDLEETPDEEKSNKKGRQNKKKDKDEEPKSKKKKRGKKEPAEEIEPQENNNSNSTSTNTTTTDVADPEKEKKREAMERYKELYRLRQQMMNSGGRGDGGQGLSPEEYQRVMRNSAREMNVIDAMFVVIRVGVRYSGILYTLNHYINRQEKIHPTQHFVYERLNDRFSRDAHVLKTAIESPPLGVPKFLWRLVLAKRHRSPPKPILNGQSSLDHTFEKTSIVIELGDDSNSGMDLRYLADLITFLLSQHQAQAFGSQKTEKRQRGVAPEPLPLEVIFKLNSPGGSVTTFGLAAAQVARLRGVKGITTTVCVDEIAASGGYMIASQANKLVAAPFAHVGSIGVMKEVLNIHDFLSSNGVTPLVLKAGERKNLLTNTGAITKKDIEEEEKRLEKVHDEFKLYTVEGRPQLAGREAEVCDGSVFLGREALALNLIDEMMTSDDYLMQRMLAGDRVLKVYRSRQSRIPHHMRFPTFQDILPHLKQKMESLSSNSETTTKVICALAFLKHVLGKTKL